MALSPAALLDLIDDAITALLTGAQSYSIGARSVTKADLGTLLEERRLLQAAVDRSSSGMFRLAKMSPTSQ